MDLRPTVTASEVAQPPPAIHTPPPAGALVSSTRSVTPVSSPLFLAPLGDLRPGSPRLGNTG